MMRGRQDIGVSIGPVENSAVAEIGKTHSHESNTC